MKGIIIRIGAVLLTLVGVGIVVDSIAERTAERVVDKLSNNVPSASNLFDDDDPLEADDII